MYQSLMIGALVGMGLTPRLAGASNSGALARASSLNDGKQGAGGAAGKAAAASAASAAGANGGDDVMRIIRKASIEKAIDLTFWW